MKLNIYHDTFIFYGGAEKICKLLSVELNAKIHTAINIEKLNKKFLFLINFFFLKFAYIFLYFFFFQNIKNFLYKDADTVNFFSSNFSLFGSLFLKKKIYYVHHLPKFAFEYKKKYKKFFFLYITIKIYKFFYLFFLNKFDFLVFNSHYTKNQFHKHVKLNCKNAVVYPFVEIGNNFNCTKKNFVLNISRFSNNKNINLFLSIVKICKDVQFVLVTSKNIFNFFSKSYLFRFKNLKIYFNLKQKKIENLYREAKFSIFLGQDEDYGMFVGESLLHNLPVICLDSGNIRNLIKNRINGIVLKNHNTLSVQKAVYQMNSWLSLQMSKNFSGINQVRNFNSKFDFVSKIKKIINYL